MGVLDTSVRGSIPRTLTKWHLSSTVEQGVEAACVPGSTPGGATKYATLAEKIRNGLQTRQHRCDSDT